VLELAAGVKRSLKYDYLLAHGQNVIQVDGDNLVREYSASMSSLDDNVDTELELAAFAAADPENIVTVAETDAGEQASYRWPQPTCVASSVVSVRF
jgi:hypothetical protein